MKQKKLYRSLVLIFILFFSVIGLIIAQTPGAPWEIPADYKTKVNPYKDDTSLKMVGQQNYNRHCTSCHGKTGKGDGVMAANLKTFPGDFTTEKFKKLTDGEVYYMSFIGRGEMPNFEKKFTAEEDRWAIINYLKNLGK